MLYGRMKAKHMNLIAQRSIHALSCFSLTAGVLSASLLMASPVAQAADTDQDSIDDTQDNCLLVANADQRDTDVDGFGNACDPDLDNDLVVNFSDLSILKAAFFSSEPNADLDGDGDVNFNDLAIMKGLFFQAPGPGADVATWWQPSPGTSWHWQLVGTIDQSYDVTMYDIDLDVDRFAPPGAPSTIEQLQAAGRIVICYMSAGTWEDFRADAGEFPEAVKGNTLDQFADERWLDIRRLDVLGPIMQARLDRAVAQGCDGVEPDNVDGWDNNSGFPLTPADQLTYNRWWADEAHARGLSVGLKNDLAQVPQLVDDFDWALNEQCFQFNECETLQPFVDAGKAVFGVEYQGSTNVFCPVINALDYDWLKMNFDLDNSVRIPCR